MIFPERVLGKPGTIWITSGLAMGPISLGHHIQHLFSEILGVLHNVVGDHISVNALSLDVVRVTHHCAFHNVFVFVDRVFHFGSANAMPGNIDYIVYTPDDSVVAIVIALRAPSPVKYRFLKAAK
jgi:hypothetical protein